MIVTVTDLYDGVTPETSPITISVIEGSATTGGGGGAVDSVNGHVGVVVLDADDLADGTTNHVFTATDDTKLAGIATGATANDTDANLKARANHTGTQAIATVTGLQTALDGKEAVGAAAAAQAASQPLDSDLTAIAALTTTAFGRALLELANAAAGRTALSLGTAAVAATGDFDAAGAAAAAQAASQPLDSDLTALAALSTTSYGRSLLEAANASALRTLVGLVLGTDIYSKAAVDSGFQPLDSDLTSIAALTTTSIGRSLLAGADAAALRTILGLGTAALISSTAGGDLSGTLPSPTVAKINGVAVTGTPSAGYVPTATSSSAATWQAAAGGSSDLKYVPLSVHAQNREFRDAADLTSVVRVDNSSSNAAAQLRAVWTRQADTLTVALDGATTTDAAGEMHGYVWPYALAVGEAVYTYMRYSGPTGSFPFGGLVISDGTTYGSGNQVFWSMWHNAVADANFQDGLWTGWNTRASFTDRAAWTTYGRDPHMRIVRDTSNVWRMQVSDDFCYWHEIGTRTLTMTPTHIGFAAGQWTSTVKHSYSFEYLRVA